MQLLKLLTVTIIYLVFIFNLAQNFTADIFHKSSRANFSKGNNEKALKDINEAITLNNKEAAYYRQKAKVQIAQRPTQPEEKIKILKNLNKSIELNPINAATLRNNIAPFYFVALDYNSYETTQIDPEILPITQEYYAQLKAYMPNDVGNLKDIAKFEKRFDTKSYENTKEIIKKLRPDLLEWHPDLLD